MCTHNPSLAARRDFLTLSAAGSVVTGAGMWLATSPSFAQGSSAEGLSEQSVNQLISAWPTMPQEVAKKMMESYGAPKEATPSHLVWHGNGPWKWSIVYREEVPHNFPVKHTDMLDQGINYKVPPEKMDELATFDGAVTVRITKGEMAAMCDKEPMNYLALNLAHEIITGEKSVEEARQFQADTVKAFLKGEKHPYTQKLIFTPPEGGTGYPDHVATE
jgi:hypothetical protein